ncbi:MAG: amidase [Proteobacteria bacterium]|nr:amidase [Pseudomonadota bacterium]
MDMTRLEWLSAGDAAQGIRDGLFDSEQLVQACLERIRQTEGEVQAWQHLDEAHALAQARARDADRREGRPTGPLHGVPVGLKDIIDTLDMPTEDGTVLHAGRMAGRDAAVVARLRAAGAVILGKTVTTELATYAAGKTRNPHDPSRTPGGSSSGSAAAVAAGMVPLTLGTQTNGSVIRPAAFCGVYGFKPSQGLVSRHGILKTSRTLDCVGWFARNLDDIALLAEVLCGHDERDTDTRVQASPPFLRMLAQEPPLPPRFAWVKTPMWPQADADTHEALAEVAEVLGTQCESFDVGESVRAAWDWHRTIMEAEMAFNLDAEWTRGRDKLSSSLQQQLQRGREVSALDYQHAQARIPQLVDGFDELFERFDAILTPAAPGSAPPLGNTGDPVFCTLWSLCGMPALNLPLLHAPDNLPMGLQLVGRRGDDARLLRSARWLVRQLQAA